MLYPFSFLFFFNDTATTEIYTLSLHDALPICALAWLWWQNHTAWFVAMLIWTIVVGSLDNILRPILIRKGADLPLLLIFAGDRKSTRLNSSHQIISYAVFCLKKKKRMQHSIAR